MCLSYREIRNEEVTVRKQHRCGWCSESITKGERARYRTYVFDGDFTSDWMHLECYSAMGESRNDVICEGWMPGDFERGQIAA